MAISATQVFEGTPEQIIQRIESLKLKGKHLRVELQIAEEETPQDPTIALFAKWEKEDARVTREEKAKNNALFTKIENNGISRTSI